MFGFDRNNIVILLIILAVFSLFRGGFDLQGTLMMLPGLILALTFHEYAHAKTADRLGDPTPEEQGRLTLNPLAHMDIAGTICLLFAGFGWGKPVQINGSYFRNPAKDNMKVALAGPVMNFILAFVLFIILGPKGILPRNICRLLRFLCSRNPKNYLLMPHLLQRLANSLLPVKPLNTSFLLFPELNCPSQYCFPSASDARSKNILYKYSTYSASERFLL